MSPRRRSTNEAGFTILECTIALTVVFAVLIGLLGALTAGARGLVTGRQRSAALALANEVMEDAHGRAYGDVGHDFDSDPTLATDPLITGTGANRRYTGVTPAEPLAASAVDAGPSAGTVNNPLYPFSPHRFTTKREQTVYTTSVYVTTVAPATGDPYKRVTVTVSWSPTQYVTTARSVTLSSFLFNAAAPPDPRLTGTGEADSGSFKISGSLAGISLADASVTFPYVNGGVDSGFVKSAKGVARSGTSQVDLLAGTISGCSLVGLGAFCDGAKAEADSDNDSGTAQPDTDEEGPTNAAAAAITVPPGLPLLSIGLGSGTAQAQATARSCWSCQAAGSLPVGDDDRLPYFAGTATGPATVTVAGPLNSGLLSIGSGCSLNCTTVNVDRDDSGANQLISSTAGVGLPAVSLLTFPLSPLGYSGMVKIGALSASAKATAGPGAAAPTVTGAAVTVQYWNGLTYSTVSVTPGVTASTTTIPSTSFLSSATLVTVSGTITASKAVTSETSSGGAVTAASASLTNWLSIDLNVSIGALATLDLNLDYGRIAATAGYQPPS
jgi:hypothetical protein